MPAVRVRLVTPDLQLLDAAIHDRAAFARALGCELAENWEVFPDALRQTRDAVAADPASVRWGPRLVILVDEPSVLVGWCGFKGRPRDGLVEIRYAVAPGSRCRGIATAVVRELVGEAFSADEVTAVFARTDAAPNPSARVLAKAGFVHEGQVADDEIGYAWRFRYDRDRA
jgi:ribosomal-protein-alanine N-acetyltransferase